MAACLAFARIEWNAAKIDREERVGKRNMKGSCQESDRGKHAHKKCN